MVLYLNMCDGEAEFSSAITPVFSVTYDVFFFFETSLFIINVKISCWLTFLKTVQKNNIYFK